MKKALGVRYFRFSSFRVPVLIGRYSDNNRVYTTEQINIIKMPFEHRVVGSVHKVSLTFRGIWTAVCCSVYPWLPHRWQRIEIRTTALSVHAKIVDSFFQCFSSLVPSLRADIGICPDIVWLRLGSAKWTQSTFFCPFEHLVLPVGMASSILPS